MPAPPAPRSVPDTSSDPGQPREVENPGDPGPPVLVPPGPSSDQRENEKLPPHETPPPGL